MPNLKTQTVSGNECNVTELYDGSDNLMHTNKEHVAKVQTNEGNVFTPMTTHIENNRKVQHIFVYLAGYCTLEKNSAGPLSLTTE